MNDDTQTPDTSSDAPRDEKLAELIKEVDEDPGTEGASEMSDRLRDQTEQSESDSEEPGDLVD
ncbi:hypothetical protein [Agreia sp. Leaf210]|jgi:hypothetical protein|uniref:hypothetical protein n=1 Tax=Agreia sp. Leaf210 TaxID=1735682 RepID=UPI0006F6F519|nr:hypothetical protein [Agreia sp. Leaf210]KQM61009.1 hypothetical protein ASE64_05190 [Agreia sp. Leaf210]